MAKGGIFTVFLYQFDRTTCFFLKCTQKEFAGWMRLASVRSLRTRASLCKISAVVLRVWSLEPAGEESCCTEQEAVQTSWYVTVIYYAVLNCEEYDRNRF